MTYRSPRCSVLGSQLGTHVTAAIRFVFQDDLLFNAQCYTCDVARDWTLGVAYRTKVWQSRTKRSQPPQRHFLSRVGANALFFLFQSEPKSLNTSTRPLSSAELEWESELQEAANRASWHSSINHRPRPHPSPSKIHHSNAQCRTSRLGESHLEPGSSTQYRAARALVRRCKR